MDGVQWYMYGFFLFVCLFVFLSFCVCNMEREAKMSLISAVKVVCDSHLLHYEEQAAILYSPYHPIMHWSDPISYTPRKTPALSDNSCAAWKSFLWKEQLISFLWALIFPQNLPVMSFIVIKISFRRPTQDATNLPLDWGSFVHFYHSFGDCDACYCKRQYANESVSLTNHRNPTYISGGILMKQDTRKQHFFFI